MSLQGQLRFGDDLVLGTLRLVLRDIPKKFDGELLDLTVLGLLASRYELEESLAPAWDRLLQPDTVYRFLIAVANGYQIQCRAILTHFEAPIKRIAKDFLDLHSQKGRSRSDLVAILERCTEEVHGELAVEGYHVEVDERALESPFDPDFESEQYYEHQSRLDIDESYAEMSRYNAKIQKDVTKRHRQKEEAEWVSLFNRAGELASTGPLEHFRIDLYHRSDSQFTSSWSIFDY
jgi:hypothetical protein